MNTLSWSLPSSAASSRASTPLPGTHTPISYYTTPAFPLKWRLADLELDEDSVPLNLGVEKCAEEDRWGALGFRLPAPRAQRARPRRHDVDWDCGICLEPAADPCVTRCGHLFCSWDLRQWLRSHPGDPRCPACKARCDERDIVPIFARGHRRARPPPMDTIPAGGTESESAAGGSPSPSPAETPASPSTPTESASSTPTELDAQPELDDGAEFVHPMLKHVVVTREVGRALSLLAFVVVMGVLMS